MQLISMNKRSVRLPILARYLELLLERVTHQDEPSPFYQQDTRVELDVVRALHEAEQTRRIGTHTVSPLTLIHSMDYLERYPVANQETHFAFIQLLSYYKSFDDIRNAFARPLALPGKHDADRTTQLRSIIHRLGTDVERAIATKYERLTAGARTDAERIADETYFYKIEDDWLTETATALLATQPLDPYNP